MEFVVPRNRSLVDLLSNASSADLDVLADLITDNGKGGPRQQGQNHHHQPKKPGQAPIYSRGDGSRNPLVREQQHRHTIQI